MRLELPDRGPIVVAVSGGVDSCVLLHKLHAASVRSDVDLVVAHVDHGLRPDSSDDADFVTQLARRYTCPVFVEKIQVRKHNSVQAQARIQRYAALSRIAHRHGTRRIATGHHAQDQSENQALKSLLGRFGDLQETRELRLWDIEVWRPLLALQRQEIELYARHHGLEWREDPSNACESYARNFVRLRDMVSENEDPIEAGNLPSLRRLTAHRWWLDGHNISALRHTCNAISGVRISRRALESIETTNSGRVFTHGAVIDRHACGFEIIRSTCQGDRALPIASRDKDSALDFGKLEF